MVRENFCMLQKSAPLFCSLEKPHYYFPGLQNENISDGVYWDEEFIYKRDVAFQPLFGYKKVGIYQIHRNGVPKNYFFSVIARHTTTSACDGMLPKCNFILHHLSCQEARCIFC